MIHHVAKLIVLTCLALAMAVRGYTMVKEDDDYGC